MLRCTRRRSSVRRGQVVWLPGGILPSGARAAGRSDRLGAPRESETSMLASSVATPSVMISSMKFAWKPSHRYRQSDSSANRSGRWSDRLNATGGQTPEKTEHDDHSDDDCRGARDTRHQVGRERRACHGRDASPASERPPARTSSSGGLIAFQYIELERFRHQLHDGPRRVRRAGFQPGGRGGRRFRSEIEHQETAAGQRFSSKSTMPRLKDPIVRRR